MVFLTNLTILQLTGLLASLVEWGFVYVYLLREVRVARDVLGLPSA